VVLVSEWRPDHAPPRADRTDVHAALAAMSASNGTPGRDLGRKASIKASARRVSGW